MSDPITINIGVCGFGTVGQGVWKHISANRAELESRVGVRLNLARAAVRDRRKARVVRIPARKVTVDALSIANGEIFLDATVHASEDPMCCPTLRTTRHYRLDVNGQLDLIDYTTFTPDGRPRTITIESPADGVEVFNSIQLEGSVAIAPFENNLTYSIKDVGGVELARGAIAVSSPDLGAPGTFEALIPLGNILSGAVIRVEVQVISAADGSLIAMDSVVLVVK